MANLSQLSYTRWNNNIKVKHNNTRPGEHYRKDEQQCVVCTSSPLVSIPVLSKRYWSQKNFQSLLKIKQRFIKQISKVT